MNSRLKPLLLLALTLAMNSCSRSPKTGDVLRDALSDRLIEVSSAASCDQILSDLNRKNAEVINDARAKYLDDSWYYHRAEMEYGFRPDAYDTFRDGRILYLRIVALKLKDNLEIDLHPETFRELDQADRSLAKELYSKPQNRDEFQRPYLAKLYELELSRRAFESDSASYRTSWLSTNHWFDSTQVSGLITIDSAAIDPRRRCFAFRRDDVTFVVSSDRVGRRYFFLDDDISSTTAD